MYNTNDTVLNYIKFAYCLLSMILRLINYDHVVVVFSLSFCPFFEAASHLKLFLHHVGLLPCRYDKIVCDVPCSGDGTLRRRPHCWKTWSVVLELHQIAIGDQSVGHSMFHQCVSSLFSERYDFYDVDDHFGGIAKSKKMCLYSAKTQEFPLSLHQKQLLILCRGLHLLRPGGRLVYSTCSMNPIENEVRDGKMQRHNL